MRGDDAAGLEVARRLRGAGVDAVEHEGDCSAIVYRLGTRAHVVIVDAASTGADPGRIHRLDPDALGEARLRSSSHAFGVPEAVALARELGRLPPSLTIYAIEGERFELGAPLSAAVAAAVDALVAELG
jgi:hydrogenase maturation protease